MKTDFITLYKRGRAKGLKANYAYRSAVSHFKRLEWRNSHGMPSSLYPDHKGVVFEKEHLGYAIELTADLDDYPHYMDAGAQGYEIESHENRGRGFTASPDFYSEHGGEYSENHSDGSINFCVPFTSERYGYLAIGNLPKTFIDQWREKGMSKQVAYEHSRARAKAALASDIESYYRSDFYRIGVRVYSPSGEEIFSEYLGGCDDEYVTSGDAFYENDFMEQALSAIKNHFAGENPNQISANYQYGAAI